MRLRPFTTYSVLIAVGFLLGCGGNTAADRFDKAQGGKTVTPHGAVVSGSSKNTKDGKVEYKTEDGRTWKVEVRPDGNYGTPEEVKGK